MIRLDERFFETGTSRFFEDMELGERDKENKDSFFDEEDNQKSRSQSEIVLIPPIAVIEDSTANQEVTQILIQNTLNLKNSSMRSLKNHQCH